MTVIRYLTKENVELPFKCNDVSGTDKQLTTISVTTTTALVDKKEIVLFEWDRAGHIEEIQSFYMVAADNTLIVLSTSSLFINKADRKKDIIGGKKVMFNPLGPVAANSKNSNNLSNWILMDVKEILQRLANLGVGLDIPTETDNEITLRYVNLSHYELYRSSMSLFSSYTPIENELFTATDGVIQDLNNFLGIRFVHVTIKGSVTIIPQTNYLNVIRRDPNLIEKGIPKCWYFF